MLDSTTTTTLANADSVIQTLEALTAPAPAPAPSNDLGIADDLYEILSAEPLALGWFIGQNTAEAMRATLEAGDYDTLQRAYAALCDAGEDSKADSFNATLRRESKKMGSPVGVSKDGSINKVNTSTGKGRKASPLTAAIAHAKECAKGDNDKAEALAAAIEAAIEAIQGE